jgi:hypothetical protein
MQRGIVHGLRTAAAVSLVVAVAWSQAPRAFARSAGIAQKVAPVLCGTLDVQIGAGFATGPSDAEECFYQAFLACAPALLTVEINPVGTGGRHTLMTSVTDSGCVVADRLEPTVDSAPTDGSSAVVCTDLTLTKDDLSEGSCSGGPPLAPIPPPIGQIAPQGL